MWQGVEGRLRAVEAACGVEAPPPGAATTPEDLEARLRAVEAASLEKSQALEARVRALEEAQQHGDTAQQDDDDEDTSSSNKGGTQEGTPEKDLTGRALVSLGRCAGNKGTLKVLENELRYLSRRIDRNISEDEDRQAQQDERDAAQDAMIKMELSRFSRELNQRASQDDMKRLKTSLQATLDGEIAKVRGDVEDSLAGMRNEARNELEDVMRGVKTMNDSNSRANVLLEKRAVGLESTVRDLSTTLDDAMTSVRLQVLDVQKTSEGTLARLSGDVERCMWSVDRLLPRTVVLEAVIADQLPKSGESVGDILTTLRTKLESEVGVEVATLRQDAAAFRRRSTAMIEFETAQREKLEQTLEGKLKSFAATSAEELEGALETLQEQHTELRDETTKLRDDFETYSLNERDRRDAESAVGTAVATETTRVLESQAATLEKDLVQAKKDTEELRGVLKGEIDGLKHALDRERTLTKNRIAESEDVVRQQVAKLNAQADTMSATLKKTEDLATASALELSSNAEKMRASYDAFTSTLIKDVTKLRDEVLKFQDATKLLAQECQRRVREQSDDYSEGMARLQRAMVGQAAVLRRLDKLCSAACTKQGIGDLVDVQLDEHARLLAVHCTELEASQTAPRPFALPYDAQKYVAAAVQKVAEKIALKADLDCLRKVLVHDDPATDDVWDDLVAEARDSCLLKFANKVRDGARKIHPSADEGVASVRQAFVSRLELLVKIGLSKHQRIQANFTLFGKLCLKPVCVACDRPFGPSGATEKSVVQPKDAVVSPKYHAMSPTNRPSFVIDETGPIDHDHEFGRNKPSTHAKRGGGFRVKRPSNSNVYHHVNDSLDDASLASSASAPFVLGPTHLASDGASGAPGPGGGAASPVAAQEQQKRPPINSSSLPRL